MGNGSHHIAGMFAHIHHLQHVYMHPKLEEVGLYRGHPPLLFMIAKRTGISQIELAKEIAVQPPTITKMIGKLEQAGFVYREPDDSDQRANRVYLTTKGESVLADLRKLFTLEEKEIFSIFSKVEKDQLNDYLTRIIQRYRDVTREART